jgi:3-methylfumaryl-CoA hydratase
MTPELPDFESWIGRQRVEEDVLALAPARGLAATLDRDPGALRLGLPLPPGWHWIYFNPVARRGELGPDGHEKRGGFLPPISLPRRMWAGGRVRFEGDLRFGDPVTRTSTIVSVREKEGRSGPLVFLTVRHEVRNSSGALIDEEQDLVYRTPPTPGTSGSTSTGQPTQHQPSEADWSEPYTADAVTLFRFSALTFNGHRIHFDHPYATQVEGYPGLVVHGPLLALLLVDAGLRNWGGSAAGFRYRALSPLFGDEGFVFTGKRGPQSAMSAETPAELAANLWAAHPERGVAMEAGLLLTD